MAEPKIELHVHLEGAVRPPVLRRLAARNGVPVPPANPPFADLYEFIAAWNAVTSCLREPADFRDITLAYAAEAASWA